MLSVLRNSKRQLLNHLKLAQNLLLSPDTDNKPFKLKEVQEIRNRLECKDVKYKIHHYQTGDDYYIDVYISKVGYEAGDYCHDIITYQLSKLKIDFIQGNVLYTATENKRAYKLKKETDKDRVLFTILNVIKGLRRGEWFYNGRDWLREIENERLAYHHHKDFDNFLDEMFG
jgi:hypothetical protein